MNSFEANKIFGALLGTIFVLFGGSLLAEGIFHSEAPEEPGYEIVAAEPDAGGAAEAPAEDPPVAALLQNANAETGASEFRKCQACHSGEEGGPNKVGPHLWDVVNRPIASVSDFSYSAGMKTFAEGEQANWDYDHLYHFIKNPKGYVEGTAMGFAGIKDPQGRADLIAYLRTLSENPAPLPEAPAEGAETAAAGEGAAETNPATSTDSATGGEGAQAPAVSDTSSEQPPADTAPAQAASGSQQPAEGAAGGEQSGQAPAGQAQAGEAPAAGGEQPAQAPAAGGEEPEQAPAAGGEQGAAAAPAEGATQTAAVSGDAEAGKSVFRRCQACHAVGPDAKNKIGPELNGIVGEKIASVEGYSFSSGLTDYAAEHGDWNVEQLTAWLENPKKVVPGTKMAFPGLNKPEDIANVIAYLNSFGEDGQQSQ